MRFFKRAEPEPQHDESFAQRLGAITGRTKMAADPYKQDPAPIVA